MAKYKITALYEYSGVISAAGAEVAEMLFNSRKERYYDGVDSFEIEQVCDDCEGDEGVYDLDDEGVCEACRDEGDN